MIKFHSSPRFHFHGNRAVKCLFVSKGLFSLSALCSLLVLHRPVATQLTVERVGGPMPKRQGPTWPHRYAHTHKHRWGIRVRTEADW